MQWHNLRLRTRILLGYGLMFVLIAALVVFLIFRTGALNAQIRDLSAQVTAEAATGAGLAAQVAATQHAIDLYLQQPLPNNLESATTSLQRLSVDVEGARTKLVSPQQQQRLSNLDGELVAYQSNFQALGALLEAQLTTRSTLNTNLVDASDSLNDAVTVYLTTVKPDSTELAVFVRAQRHLQLTVLWSARLVTEQTENHGQLALDELNQVDFNLKLERNLPDNNTRNAVTHMFEKTQHARTAISQYMGNLAQVRQQRDTLLNIEGGQLKDQADAIAGAALEQLTSATSDLERQGQQTQQLTGAALVVILLIAAAFGVLLPRTITRPLMELVVATKRLDQGDFDVVVSTRDGSEIGQLATAFNETTAALGQQRREVLRQQTELAEQNHELERTLTELRASATAREQMAATIRTLSVPVVPILEHVILIPLVGEIDSERARTLLERLLERITAQRARIAILDITGVPFVDVSLVDWLLKATSSAWLMGARCILVGISPEVAQALVASGADLADLTTRADLRSAVEYASRGAGFIVAKS
jgi:rsbT co-antagonist protein RsbR